MNLRSDGRFGLDRNFRVWDSHESENGNRDGSNREVEVEACFEKSASERGRLRRGDDAYTNASLSAG